MENFNLLVELLFAYKLNDLIKNNIYNSRKQRDGNLTVIGTIISLFKQSYIAFNFMPQIDIYTDYHSKKPYSDIDIVCISDGRFIIGEAKHTSKAFFKKNSENLTSLDTLCEIAKVIRPDKIIISCYDDVYIYFDKARKTLEGKFYQDVMLQKLK